MTLFDDLPPPSGGLGALRLRILADEAHSRRRRRVGIAAVTLALAASASWVVRPPHRLPDDPVLVAAMGSLDESVVLAADERLHLALTAVPLEDSRVIYARIDGVPR